MKKAKRVQFNIFTFLIGLFLAIYTISMCFALIWALMNSLKTTLDFKFHPFELPQQYKFENYVQVFESVKIQVINAGVDSRYVYIAEMFFNSLLYTVGVTFFSVMSACCVAYAAAKYKKYAFMRLLYSIAIVVMILPIVGALPAQINISQTFGFYDNIVGAWFMKASCFGTNFLVLYASYSNVSWDYAEAAFIDGASHFRVFFNIMIPLVSTSIYSMMLLSFISNWNDYYFPMIFLPSMPTAAYGLFKFQSSTSGAASSIPIQLAACVFLALPIFVLFVIFKEKLIGNISIGGLKG